VLHDLGAALRHADRVIVLKQGQLLADGPPAQAITPPCWPTSTACRPGWSPAPRAFPRSS